MSPQLNIAILGATGVVGETIVSILENSILPINKIYLLASERSIGQSLVFKNRQIYVEDVKKFDFKKVKIAFFSAGAEVSRIYAPKATATGCIVIDNTSEFRYHDDIPLVITEINPHCLADYKKRNIISNPNCSTMQMLVALKPLYDLVGIKKICVSTYQSVSGTGRSAITELVNQTTDLLNGKTAECNVYPKQIAFNVLPHIDQFLENGFTREEMKMVWETKKIMQDPNIEVNATTVRVPVLYGHSQAVYIETILPLTAKTARETLINAPGVVVVDNPNTLDYPTPMSHAVGEDPVFVGRIRNALNNNHGLNLWIVADNIRKGAALNSVQIAEELFNKYLIL